MKKVLYIILVSGFSLILIACAEKEESTTTDTAAITSSDDSSDDSSITSGSTTTATGSISVGSESLTGSYSSSCLTTDREGTTLSSSVSGGSLPSNTIAMKYYLIVTSSSSLEFSEYFYSDASCLTSNVSVAEIWTYFSVDNASGSNYLITYTRYSTSFISYDTTAKTFLDTAFETTTTIGTAHTVLNDSPRKDIIYVSSNSVKIGQSSSSDHPSSVYDTEMTK